MGKLEPPLPLCLCFLNPNVTETLTGHDGYENDNMHWSLDSCQVPILFGVLQSLGEWKVLDIFSVIFWIRKEILGSCCLIQKGFTYWALNRQEKKQLSLFRIKKRKTFLGPLSLSRNFPPGVMNWHRKELKHHIWTSPCHVPSDVQGFLLAFCNLPAKLIEQTK